jgi:nicotinate-nucleotide--dimethylbenzimidazole phosphoribosyltransferase
MPFSSLEDFRRTLAGQPGPNEVARAAAAARNAQLTKPPGALARLEEIAIWYAGWRADPRPRVTNPQIVIFAGNHGVAAQGVSAFPVEVTAQMVASFQAGGAAINQLARAAGARLDVHALQLDTPTADFTRGPAMSESDVLEALNLGWEAVDPGCDLLVAGEMGIGNTTAAAAIATALFGGTAGDWCGRGTGIDDAGLARKEDAVERALFANPSRDPLEVLRCLGGRELAAMAGAVARARTERIPVLLDGFICTAAAATLALAQQGALDHCLAGHVSQEPGHLRLLDRLELMPLLSLGLRLGEGSGAALAIGIVRAALECHSGMATFAEAGVSGG